jgi:membrane associated rhomboid family serine protease
MIPLGDVIPVRTRPYITLASMAAIPVAAWVLRDSSPEPSWLQIAANVLSLWIFGRTVEDRMGHGRFAAFCALCGGLAAVVQSMADPRSPMLNPILNGAVAGVIAAYFVLYRNSKVAILVPVGIALRVVEVPAVVFLAIWFLTQALGEVGSILSVRTSPMPGLLPSWGHLAGFAAGAGAVLLFRRPDRLRVEWWNDLGTKN